MDPATLIAGLGSLLQGGGAIADLFNGGATDVAKQQLQSQQFIQMALLKLAQSGQTDARGNTVTYDPKKKMWTTALSPVSQHLLDASDAEEMARTQHDQPLAREENTRAAASRGEQDQLSNEMLNEIRHYNPVTPDRLSSDMYTSAATGLKEGYGQVANDVSTQAIRGGSGGQQLLDQLARSYARDLGTAKVNSRLQAITGSTDVNNSRVGSMVDRFRNMRSGADNSSNVPFNPSSIAGGLNNILGNSKSIAVNGVGGAGGITGTGYGNLIGQDQNYYQSAGMAGNDILSSLSHIIKGADSSSSTPPNPYAGIPQAQRAGF